MARLATIFVTLLAVLEVSASPSVQTLSQVKDALNRSQAPWQAGESWVTELSPKERQRLFGAELPEGFGDEFRNRSEAAPSARSRAALDWRNYGGENYVSPMLNQGRCGSCVAFAVIGALETQMNISRRTPNSPWAFSPQHLFSCGGGGCESGWRPGDAMSYLKSSGVPDETCFPYLGGAKGEDISCKNTCANSNERSLKIADHNMPTWLFGSKDAVKNALQKGPVVTSMLVYDDFLYYKSGIYKHTTGSMAGGHAVTIIGFSDEEKVWIIRNSWGEDWGEKGFAKISWDDTSGIGTQTWAMTLGEPEGFVTLGSLRDRQVMERTVLLTPQSSVAGHHGFDILVQDIAGNVTFVRPIDDQKFSLDTTKYKDGVYVMSASMKLAGKELKSQPRTVYVLNGALASEALKFTNLKEGQELKEKFVFEFDAVSTPVPFTEVVFTAKHLTSGKEVVRRTPNVAPKMALNWRLADAEVGEYDVRLTGKAGAQSIDGPSMKVKVIR